MSLKIYRYGPLRVTVKEAGEAEQPWGPGASMAYKYDVTVKAPNGTVYKAQAWGSAADWQEGAHRHREMARIAVDELYSAITDPDEWFNIVIGEEKGRAAYERGKVAEAIIATAQKMGHQAVEQGGEASIREEEEGTSPKDWDPRAEEED